MTFPSCKLKNNDFPSWLKCKNHTDKPGGHEGLHESVRLGFIHSVRLQCEDGVMWGERGKRGGGAYRRSIPVLSCQLSHFLALLHAHLLCCSVSPSLHFCQRKENVELVWKTAAVRRSVAAGVELIFMGFLNEATHVSSLNAWTSTSQSLALYPSPCPITSLPSLTHARSLSVHSCDAYAIKSCTQSSHLHLYCVLYNTDCHKAALQRETGK